MSSVPPLPPETALRNGRASTRAFDRRAALKLLASGFATALSSCGVPPEEIVPYVEMPERVVPGVPLRFATTLPLAGYGRGVLVTSFEGKPVKVEGNPRHPASLGSTDVFAEASVLSLYDPDRSKAPRGPDGIASWDAFAAPLQAQLQQENGRGGAGLRILTGRITSPTLLRQLNDLTQRYPNARRIRYEPIDDDASRKGTAAAFGRPLLQRPRLADAAVVLSLDADVLGAGPQQIQMGRDFSQHRKVRDGSNTFIRLYSIEPSWSLTGANADHRFAASPAQITGAAMAIAAALGASLQSPELPADLAKFAKITANDLIANQGRALVLAGARQPPEVHALCHWMNARLNAPVDFIEPIDPASESDTDALAALADDCRAGRVGTLVMVGVNPVYDAPGELKFADAMAKAGLSIHAGLYEDETAERCQWHLPLSHPLESWSDLRAVDGTASIVQPLIRRLYDTRTAHEIMAGLSGNLSANSYDLVRATWQSQAGQQDFDAWWRQTLHDGVIANTAAAPVTVNAPSLPAMSAATDPGGLTLTFAPDPSVWDGSYSNNAWLQECPKPMTKQVWGNALHLSPRDAESRGLREGDIVRLKHGDHQVEALVSVQSGQAPGVVSTTFGYGRETGTIGSHIGFNAFELRPRSGDYVLAGVTLEKTGKRQELLTTQHHFELEGEHKDLLRNVALREVAGHDGYLWPQHRSPPTLYPPHDYNTYAWAMVIDNSLCIGCNACVVACQAENNVPVVGPEQISVGRDMHWLRIDSYYDEPGDGFAGFEPVPCMHCEHAPCEPVCPVAASVHDGEGLNVQVYNRCVGTRFCQSNCPYKVRRFNFFGFADKQPYANMGAESYKAQKNPEVTVRSRGVMEKCTYCVQRISLARRDAERENRRIRDGEMVTACQAACPTRAIMFGDRNNDNAEVNVWRKQPHHYEMLGHLGTRPRTTYLARVRNPNPAFEERS